MNISEFTHHVLTNIPHKMKGPNILHLQNKNEMKKKMIDLATSPHTYQVSSDSQCMMTRKPAGLLVKALDCGSKSPGQPYLKNWVQGFLLRPLEGTLSRQSWGTP